MRSLLMAPIAALMTFCACQTSGASENTAKTENKTEITTESYMPDTTSAKVLVKTSLGNFTVLLYGDTPKHRVNFLKLAKEGYYDSTLFHRVIKEFMVQAGDPDSRTAAPGQHLGAGGPDYKIDAEIVFPAHFHKRGALAAARQGDQVNPMKQSSGSQFYIVTGQKIDSTQIAAMEARLAGTQKQEIFNRLAMEHRDSIIEMQRRGDRDGLRTLQDTLIAQTEAEAAKIPAPAMTAEMKQAYTTVGGAPHLDGAYTVFGEIVDGMDVIDKIEKVSTDRSDRPKEDIRILSMEVLD